MRRFFLFGVLLASLRGQDAAKLEHARAVNLERAAKLPNFVADEKAVRYKSRHSNPPKWEYVDEIESEIVVQGAGFTRQHTLLNGTPWSKSSFPNFTWSVSFGTELEPLFGKKCQTRIEFEGPVEALGKQLLAYRFFSPPNGCFGSFTIKNGSFVKTKRYSPPWTGRFLIDDPGGDVIQFEDEATEFPKGFGADALKTTTSWDYVKIGETSYLLPVTSEVFGGFTRADTWHVVSEYKNHRHFETATSVTFQ